MSLDVYLCVDEAVSQPAAIFVRRDGQTMQISREEWDGIHPDIEPVMVRAIVSGNVYHANVTHNLGQMAREAGIYECLWRPDEIGVTKATQLIDTLRDGLKRLQDDQERFKSMNPVNGWGTYEGLVAFVGKYVAACVEWPHAEVRVSR